jgi:phosphoserine phosphatase RsbU/P
VQTSMSDDPIATHIWRSIVRESLPVIPNYQHWIMSKPATCVGGDFHAASDDYVFVGDVSGKGLPAALLTGMFVAATKFATQMRDLGKSLELALYDELERSEKFATLAALKLGPDGWLTYLTLGHPPILNYLHSHHIIELKTSEAPLGVVRKASYPMRSARLKPGNWICIYTDGVIEAERDTDNGTELFGVERLKDMMATSMLPEVFFANITHELKSWNLTDDMTLVILQYWPDANWLNEPLDRR